ARGRASTTAAPVPRERHAPLGPVRARQLRRRLRPADVHRLPLRAQVRRLAAGTRDRLLLDRDPAGALIPTRGALRRQDRPPTHNGLHPSALEPTARGGRLRAQPRLGDRAAARPLLSLADGRAAPAL